MTDLYQGVNSSLITLSDDTPPFDSSFYDAVVEELYGLGGYTPEYLTSNNGAALINETYNILRGAVNVGLNEEVDPNFKEALENNVFMFSGFKTHQELEEVNALLRDGNGNIRPFDQFKLDVLNISEKYNVNYLQAEYNMAVQSAQMASKWQDFEAHKNFVNLQYRTAGDDRVRAEHQALDGTTLPVEDAFWKEYMPPLGWNCRCTVVEVLKDSEPVSNSEQAIKAGEMATSKPAQKIFRFNPGITKQVFPPKHPYYKVGGVNGKRIKNRIKRENYKRHYINELNTTDYSEIAKKAIAENNLEVEEYMKIKKGNLMSIYMADEQKANPKLGQKDYDLNCQVCTAVYLLRKRGFDVIALKPNTHLMYNPFDKWLDINGQKIKPTTWFNWADKNNIKSFNDKDFYKFFKENCKDKGTYEVVIKIKNQETYHATIIESTENGLLWIDPQDHKAAANNSVEFLSSLLDPSLWLDNEMGIIRIDNKIINPNYLKVIAEPNI